MRGRESGKRTSSDHVGRQNDVPEEVIRQLREHDRSRQRWKGEGLGLEIFCGNE